MYIAPGQGQITPWRQNFDINRNILLLPPYVVSFFHKMTFKQIWPCRKKGQGHIWTNFVGPKSTMLHTKPQGHWPFGSREEDFKGFLPYMGMVAILVMWPRPSPLPRTNFLSPDPWGLYMKFGFDWPSSFWGEMFEESVWWMDGRRSLPILKAHPWAQVS